MTAVQTQPHTLTLARLMARQNTDCATALLDGQEVVTLGVVAGGDIEVVIDGQVKVVGRDTRVVPVEEPQRQVMLLATAALIASRSRRTAAIQFAGIYNRVRDYAIARHEDGLFCREGLNAFLRAFDWPEYDPDDQDEDEDDETDDEEGEQ
jgi:hypothetical protein